MYSKKSGRLISQAEMKQLMLSTQTKQLHFKEISAYGVVYREFPDLFVDYKGR